MFASAVTLLVITFTGGRPAMVSASAGSMALVLAGLIQAHGLSYMLAATILTGFLQFIFRLFRYPQIDALYSQDSDVRIRQCVSHFNFHGASTIAPSNTVSYGMIICSILLIYLLPKFITIVPPAFVILFMTILSIFKRSFANGGDLGEMSQFHPAIRWPNVPINLKRCGLFYLALLPCNGRLLNLY